MNRPHSISRALYYPYIRVPNSPWFTRVLLYWDEVGAIVPYDYIEEPDRLGPYMAGLVREELVRQVIPGAHLWKVKGFERAFLDHVDRRGNEGRTAPAVWSRVHMEKLQTIGDELCARGLARRHNGGHSPWFEVEAHTAAHFMAYLAGVLGQIPGETFCPITDQAEDLAPFAGRIVDSGAFRQVILEGVLPAPAAAIEPARLAEFKAAHGAALRRFRREIEDRISEVMAIADRQGQTARVEAISATLRDQTDDLVDRMQRHKMPRIGFDTICAVIGSGISARQAMATDDWRLGLVGTALSVAPAVFNAFRGSDLVLEDKPLAYAALAQSAIAE